MRLGDAGDEAISENYRYIDLLLVNSSLVFSFSLKLQ